MNIHSHIAIRTHDPRNRTASDLRLKGARSSASAFHYVYSTKIV